MGRRRACFILQGRRVTGVIDGLQQALRIEVGGHAQLRLLGGQVDADRQHTRQLGQGTFHAADAAGAGHAADGELKALAGDLITGAFDCREQLRKAVLRRLDACLFAGQVDAGAGNLRYVAQGAFDPAGTTGAGHAADR
ncbi:hypothetical protein D9M68_695540 [compost metagenome]